MDSLSLINEEAETAKKEPEEQPRNQYVEIYQKTTHEKTEKIHRRLKPSSHLKQQKMHSEDQPPHKLFNTPKKINSSARRKKKLKLTRMRRSLGMITEWKSASGRLHMTDGALQSKERGGDWLL